MRVPTPSSVRLAALRERGRRLAVPGRRPETLRFLEGRATLSRSLGLLRSFPLEQSDPDRFYRGLADDTRELLGALVAGAQAGDAGGARGAARGAGAARHDNALAGATVLDVGGGPGYFRDSFADVGARYVSVEPDPVELSAAGLSHESVIRGSGMALPIADDAVYVCFSSNVAEHVPEPWTMADEMVRITRPGGLIVLSYTLWFGPFGGHEMGLTHYLGGARAARMYERRHGHRPKNFYGESLFEVGCAEGLRWAEHVTASGDAELLAAFPRYHPAWAWWATRIPLFREVAVSNLVLVLEKRGR